MSISLVQNTSSNPAASNPTLVFASNVTAGNLLIVAVNYIASGAVTSVTDSQGNTYTACGTELSANNAGAWWGKIFLALAGSTGANTVTVNSGSNLINNVFIYEFSGVSAQDQFGSAFGSGTAVDSGGVTTSAANEALFGFYWATGASTTQNPGTGWTALDSQGGSFHGWTQYEIVSSTGTHDCTATLGTGKSGTPSWAAQIVTFFSGANVHLSGVSSTTHIGSVTVSGTASVSPTGISSTTHLGTVVPAVTVRAIGISSTALFGTASAHGDANATGSITPIATHVGTLTITGTAALTLTGVSSAILIGTAVAQVKMLPTGVSSTSHIGSTSITLAKTLTGVQSTSHVGTLTFVTTDVINLIGIQVTCSVGLPLVTCNSAFPMIAFVGM